VPSRFVLRAPVAGEHAALTALCLRSKAVYGYDAAFMEACRDELRVDGASLRCGPAAVAADAVTGRLLGFAQVSREDGVCELEALFVEPEDIGSGVGRALFSWTVEAASGLGAREMVIASDPGAEPFYLAMGAVRRGEIASVSIPGRFLPRLVYDVAARMAGTRPSQ